MSHGLPPGVYTITSASSGKALDANYGATPQISPAHPRIFMWDHVPTAANHQWHVELLPNGTYLLRPASSPNKSLDGNVGVPQNDPNHPKPFLWDVTPGAPNHQWRLVPTGPDTYGIVNVSNGKAIDANTGATAHPSPAHQSPFLWDFVPSAANHQWRFNTVPGHFVTITSASSGKALDANTSATPQISPQHPRIFMWDHVPSAGNHQWALQYAGNGGYLIVSHSNGLALDGNTGVPQNDPAHPKPFLWQPTPGAPNHHWRFVPIPGTNHFGIVNAANGLALDANTGATAHPSPAHQSPFLWQFVPNAPNHQWVVNKL